MIGKLWAFSLWSVGLCLANAVVYLHSPRPFMMSGNGFNPIQLVGLLGSMVCTIGLLITAKSLGAGISAVVGPHMRHLAVIGGLVISALFLLFAWKSFREFEATTAYFKHSGPNHRWGVVNQYTIAYWATSWQFWLGILNLGIITGIRWGGRKSPANIKG